MAATVFEALLAHIAQVIVDADTPAAGRVFRGSVDELDPALAPCIKLNRGDTVPGDQALLHDNADEHQLTFRMHCVCTGAGWESDCDALHQAAHVALREDSKLRELDLGMPSTSASGRAGDPVVGELICIYTVSVPTDDALADLF